MTDIQKMIEEEGERNSIYPNYTMIDEYAFYNLRQNDIESFQAGANFALSKLQHANRWRKVSEELPDNQDIVLVKTDKGCFATAYLHGKESGFIVYGDDAYREFGKIIEWKPI